MGITGLAQGTVVTLPDSHMSWKPLLLLCLSSPKKSPVESSGNREWCQFGFCMGKKSAYPIWWLYFWTLLQPVPLLRQLLLPQGSSALGGFAQLWVVSPPLPTPCWQLPLFLSPSPSPCPFLFLLSSSLFYYFFFPFISLAVFATHGVVYCKINLGIVS